ncbi:MAG: fibronectin type III domain-containing protein, partial [Longimicrobiales bacterium]
MPTEVAGAQYIRTANADRNVSRKLEFLSFDVNQDVIVYVADHDRATRPAWLKGWTDSGLDLYHDEKGRRSSAYSLFRKSFPKGRVWLGSNYWGDGGNMYSVIVLSATPAASPAPAPAPSDTQAPSVPQGLKRIAVSPTGVGLGWSASKDNVGVAGYIVYRDDAEIARTQTTTAPDNGLAPGSTHTYEVAAYDSAGNSSARSAALTVKLPLPIPTGPQPSFPGAEGFGATALQACRKLPVEVLEVTNLNDAGRGSLRQAIDDARNDRFSFIVFHVAGYITTQSRIEARGKHCLYIAGQTAPGDGVTIRGANGILFRDSNEDVVLRHLRFRLGHHGTIYGHIGLYVMQGRRFVIDHVSTS